MGVMLRLVFANILLAFVLMLGICLCIQFHWFKEWRVESEKVFLVKSAEMMKYGHQLGLDCDGVVKGMKPSIDKARTWKYETLDAKSINQLASGMKCDSLATGLGFNYSRVVNASSKPSPVGRLAHAVLAHQGLEQTLRLVRALTFKNDDLVCVHVDAKATKGFYEALEKVVRCIPGVVLPKKRINVKWGRISVVDALMSCMQRLEALKIPWTHLLNAAATAFPLRTRTEAVTIINYLGPKYNVIGSEWNAYRGRRTWWKEQLKDVTDIRVVKGSQYGIFTRDFVKFLVGDKRVRQFRKWLLNTEVPDEFFYASLNYDDKIKAPGSLSHKRNIPIGFFNPTVFVQWIERGSWLKFRAKKTEREKKYQAAKKSKKMNQLSSKYRPVNCASSRNWVCIFGLWDVRALVQYPHFQVNKFLMSEIQPATFFCIEEWHRNKTLSHKINVDWNYYRKIKERIRTGARIVD